ncbi:MAG: Glu-tRNA(Gln) amidotransferase subunit GatD [Candidatus Diapherotrites archaeon]|nr:Glu-tRNA(Gln) amidotransferase subunit GatD [Candidatus Diapherotrites archaeon]
MDFETGERVKIEKNSRNYEGIVIPSSTYEGKDYITIKLDNGYNIGLKIDKGAKVEKLGKKAKVGKFEADVEIKETKGLPRIAVLSTGGTIASRVDYTHGGVRSDFTTKDLILAIPEIQEIANIETEEIGKKLSENIDPEDWVKMAKGIEKGVNKGVDGIVVTHGTDTMHYSSAAVSFMIQNTGVPVVFVGAQRSSDRPSSDAATNLLSALYFAGHADVSGVYVCMHENMDDGTCLIHKGTKVRKMHSSRRDAFKSINTEPVARITMETRNGKLLKKGLEWIEKPKYKPKQKKKISADTKIETNVALLKMHPGFDESLLKTKAKGIVLEGTGLGNINERYLKAIEKLDIPVVVATQTVYGKVNLNVYEPGRMLINAGVIPANDMTAETALVKLMWVLAHAKKDEVKNMMSSNLAGELE